MSDRKYDSDLQLAIAGLEETSKTERASQIVDINGITAIRTVIASFAKDTRCVACHNKLPENRHEWRIGDIMGAYVVDRDASDTLAYLHRLAFMFGTQSAVVMFLTGILSGQVLLLRAHSREMRELAQTDALTGCLNRRALFRQTSRIIERRQTNTQTDCLLMLDIDHFKKINDTHGHAAGDEVLCQFADLLRSCVRDSDIVSRVGGEEFVLFLCDIGIDSARIVAQRIRERTENSAVEFEGVKISFTVSIGGVHIQDENRSDVDTSSEIDRWISLADKCLYAAKNLGRNRVEFA